MPDNLKEDENERKTLGRDSGEQPERENLWDGYPITTNAGFRLTFSQTEHLLLFMPPKEIKKLTEEEGYTYLISTLP